MTISIFIGLLTTALVLGAYFLLATSWPRLYYGPDARFEAFISAHLWAFVAFRSVPIVVITGVTIAYAGASGKANALHVLLAFIVSYSLFLLVFRVRHRMKYGRILSSRDWLWYAAIIVVTSFAASIGLFASPLISQWLPPLGVIRDALFTAVLIAVILAAFSRFKAPTDYVESLARRRIRENADSVRLVEAIAKQENIPRGFTAALLIAESLQRPKWTVGMEALVSSIGIRVTSGPFQQQSSGGKSLDEQVRDYVDYGMPFKLARLAGGEGMDQRSALAVAAFASHNNSRPFVDLAFLVRQELIRFEFDAGYTAFGELERMSEFGLEVSDLQSEGNSTSDLHFCIHLRSNMKNVRTLMVKPAGDGEMHFQGTVSPGETIRIVDSAERMALRWEVWTSADGDESELIAAFVPFEELGFEPKWNG